MQFTEVTVVIDVLTLGPLQPAVSHFTGSTAQLFLMIIVSVGMKVT